MTLGEKQQVFTRALALLLQYAALRGFEIRMGQVTRTREEAKRLGFENSNHTRRLAADLNLFRGGEFLTRTSDHRLLGEFWENLTGDYEGTNLVFCWGGRFSSNPDGNHYSIQHGETR